MRMRQSIAQFEEAMHEQMADERVRRDQLRRAAAERSRRRRAMRQTRHGTLRFVGLVLSIVATAVIVTVVMFETLALLIGG